MTSRRSAIQATGRLGLCLVFVTVFHASLQQVWAHGNEPAGGFEPFQATQFGGSDVPASDAGRHTALMAGREQQAPDLDTLQAASEPMLEGEMREMVISAQRVPVRHSELRRTVHIINREQIRSSSAHDIPSLLGSIAGVDVRTRGAFGMQSDVAIRGGTFDQTLVLLNGVNITDPQTGHHNMNIPVDLQSIERIEILHGPGARVFGPNAFNGAVNIITREPGKAYAAGQFTAGQHRLGTAGVSAGFRTAEIAHHVSVTGMQTDGYTTNTDFRTLKLFYRSWIPAGPGHFDLQTGYENKAFGANSFYTPRFPDQFEQTRTLFASMRWQPRESRLPAPVVYWRRHNDRFELFRDASPDWYDGHNFHQTDVAGVTLGKVFPGRYGTTSVGLDYRFEHIFSNVLGRQREQPRRVSGHQAYYTHSWHRSGLGLMLEQSLQAGAFSASAGMLVYANTDLHRAVTLFPGLDLGWQLHETLRWYISANRTLRLPTFTDLFYSGPENLGNDELRPETAYSLESGVKRTGERLHIETAVFRRWGQNMIDWTRRSGDELWKSENLTSVTLTGVETSVRYSFNSQRYVQLGYARVHASRQSGDFLSNYALDHLRHKVTGTLHYKVTERSGIQLVLRWQDRAGSYMLFEDNEFVGTRPFEPFFITDAKIWHRTGPLTLFAEGANLLDTHYHDIANVRQPGRWLRIGLEVAFR